MFDFAQPHVLLIGLGAFFIAVLIFRVDNRVEGLKKGALEYRDAAQSLGLTFIADFLRNFAVGDKSGMIAGMAQGINALRDEDQRVATVRRVFKASAQILWDKSPELRRFVREELLKLESQEDAEKKAQAGIHKLEGSTS